MARSKDVYQFTRMKLFYFSKLPDNQKKAIFAELRHGLGKKPGEVPSVWGIIFEDMPDEWMRKDGNASYEENAVYGALTLYALHMQGKDHDMQNNEQTIGNAIGKLAAKADFGERIRKRFIILLNSQDVEGLTYYLRGLINMLRKENIGFDYARLAKDLYEYEFPDHMNRIRLSWGQDYYHIINKIKRENEEHE